MIRFSLQCSDGHQFESWFQSSSAFDRLLAAGHVVCDSCGSQDIRKSLMAPALPRKGNAAEEKPLSAAQTDQETAIAALKKKVETSSDYVGLSFASEARAIHDGDAPDRPIYGEATGSQTRKLLEDGIPVLPLPFKPTRKTN